MFGQMNLSLSTRANVPDVCLKQVHGYSGSVGSGTYLGIPLEVFFGSKRSSAGIPMWECWYLLMMRQPYVRIRICSFQNQIQKIW
jgi:hypothetical protein